MITQFARATKATTSPFAFQQALIFLCNLYRRKVATSCADPSVPPNMTNQIASALSYLTKDTVYADTLFQALSELFVKVALLISAKIGTENYKAIPVNLYFLVRPLYRISKRNKRYMDFDSNPPSDTAYRYFIIWQHIVLQNVPSQTIMAGRNSRSARGRSRRCCGR